MNFVKRLFWNKEQTRLRAIYRILIQATAFFILMKGLAALAGVPDEITALLPLGTILILSGIRLFRVLISVWLTGKFIDRRPFSEFGLQMNKEWWARIGFWFGIGRLSDWSDIPRGIGCGLDHNHRYFFHCPQQWIIFHYISCLSGFIRLCRFLRRIDVPGLFLNQSG